MRSYRSGSFLVAAMVLALSACSDDLDETLPTNFFAVMNGAYAGTTSTGSGSADLALGSVTGSVTWAGVTATSVTIRAGNSGAANTATVLVNVCGAGAAAACSGTTANLTGAEQVGTDAAIATAFRAAGSGAFVLVSDAAGPAIRGPIMRD
jgi:hypothetical protein